MNPLRLSPLWEWFAGICFGVLIGLFVLYGLLWFFLGREPSRFRVPFVTLTAPGESLGTHSGTDLIRCLFWGDQLDGHLIISEEEFNASLVSLEKALDRIRGDRWTIRVTISKNMLNLYADVEFARADDDSFPTFGVTRKTSYKPVNSNVDASRLVPFRYRVGECSSEDLRSLRQKENCGYFLRLFEEALDESPQGLALQRFLDDGLTLKSPSAFYLEDGRLSIFISPTDCGGAGHEYDYERG
jgi:hypothetical protein